MHLKALMYSKLTIATLYISGVKSQLHDNKHIIEEFQSEKVIINYLVVTSLSSKPEIEILFVYIFSIVPVHELHRNNYTLYCQ